MAASAKMKTLFILFPAGLLRLLKGVFPVSSAVPRGGPAYFARGVAPSGTLCREWGLRATLRALPLPESVAPMQQSAGQETGSPYGLPSRGVEKRDELFGTAIACGEPKPRVSHHSGGNNKCVQCMEQWD